MTDNERNWIGLVFRHPSNRQLYSRSCEGSRLDELLTDSENISKNATPFDDWLKNRDAAFRKRHLIPDLPDYDFGAFEEFWRKRADLIGERLRSLQ